MRSLIARGSLLLAVACTHAEPPVTFGVLRSQAPCGSERQSSGLADDDQSAVAPVLLTSIHNTLESLGEPALRSYVNRNVRVVRLGSSGGASAVTRLERS